MEVEFEEQKQHPLVVTDEWNSKQHPLVVTDDWKSKQHPLVVNDEWRSRGTVIECNSYMLHSKIACDVCVITELYSGYALNRYLPYLAISFFHFLTIRLFKV
jgi:hypothetical protein